MADKTVRGRFVWHELLTPDTASAHKFYSSVVGWKTQPWDQDPSYVMFVASSGPLGGTASLDSGEPHWIAYIGTDNIEESVEQAGALGARVSKAITEMPNGGKYALLVDPQGATFGVYSSASEPQPEKAPKRGEFSWHELATSDYRAAFDFYSAVFGWEPTGEHDMGPLGTYFTFGRNGKQIGGIFNRPAEAPGGPSWVSYVRVRDVQKAVKKAQSGRGALINGPMEVPGGDWIAQFADPQGAVFAVHTVAADLKSSETESVPTREEESESLSPEVTQETKPAAKSKAAPARKSSSKSSAKAAGTKAKKAAKSTKKSKVSGKRTSKKAAGAKQAAKKVTKKASKKGARKAVKQSRGSVKRRTAARAAKRPARKAGKAKRSGAKRSGGKKQAAKRARRAK